MRKFLSLISPLHSLSCKLQPQRVEGCSISRVMGCSISSTAKNGSDEYVEGIVCRDTDIKENEMKSFDLEDAGKILLVRQNGNLTAVGSKCTHYGAPLVTGALGNGRVRCPWHGACFNITTGDIEDFPGLDSLPCYEVKVENNNVKVRARRRDLETNKRLNPMCKRERSDITTYVVIGAGPAGATCVETLRQNGYKGRIVMVSKEKALPYDRVKVSKAMDLNIEKIQFRTDEFYKEHDIDVLKGVEATAVDTQGNIVKLSNGNELQYTKLFIGTGLKAIKVNVPGSDLKNIEVLRNFDHSMYVQSQLTPEKELVVLGGSFIALEAASYAVNKVKKVTVIMRDVVPFKALLGPEIGAAFMKFFEEKGILFRTKSGFKRCIGNDRGEIEAVELIDGDILKADLCIMGVGSSLYTEFLQDSGLEIKQDGSIEVDEYMQTHISNIYAGGDIVLAPVWSHDNMKAVIGHYPLAHMHGRIAALNMVGKETPLCAVPFFWTMLFGKGIRYAGHGKYDEILYSGNVDGLKFVAFYLDGDKVIGVSSCQMDPYVAKYAEVLAEGRQLYRKDLTGEDLLDWAT